MGRLVTTLLGDLDEDDLEVDSWVEEHANARTVYTRWRLRREGVVETDVDGHGGVKHRAGDRLAAGTVVRQDAAPSILRGLGVGGTMGKLG